MRFPLSWQTRRLVLDASVLLLGAFRELTHAERRPIENTVGGFKPRPLGWGITGQCSGRHADRSVHALQAGCWIGQTGNKAPRKRRLVKGTSY